MFGLVNLKPPFWEKNVRMAAPGSSEYLFNYRRIWKDAILLTGIVALFPLIFITLVNYRFTGQAMGSELLLRTSRTVSNTQRAISFFLTERRSALEFIVHDNSAEVLQRSHPTFRNPGKSQTQFWWRIRGPGIDRIRRQAESLRWTLRTPRQRL